MHSRDPLRRRATRAAVTALVWGCFSGVVSPAADAESVPAPEPGSASVVAGAEPAPDGKDFLLFVGLAVTLPEDGKVYRLEDVSRGQARLRGPDGERTLPVRNLAGLETSRETVVTRLSARVENVKVDAGFSAGRDPRREALRHEGAAASWATENAQRVASAEVSLSTAGTNPTGFERDPVIDRQIREERVARATDRLQSATHAAATDVNDPTYVTNRALSPGAPGQGAGEDAVEVSFEVAAPAPMEGAFAVLVTILRLPQDGGTPAMSVAVRDLPALGPKPRRVLLVVEGLPPGSRPESTEIHLYHRGREIGTNLSERRIELTRAEAFQYLVLKYTMEHPGQDRPPQLVPELLPREFAARVPAEQRERAAEVRVDSAGRVLDFTLERAGSHPADEYIAAVLREALFFPALLKGQPVATTTSVVLSEFAP